MTSRRHFLAGASAAALWPAVGWAEAGAPAYVGAAQSADGRYWLCGLAADGALTFRIALPERGHAAATHPSRPEAVTFARRPGTFAIVFDCATGAVVANLTAPEGRHFYGHGAFSPDGETLFTTENDYEAGQGVLGVWRSRGGYTRVGEISSGGTGPHEIRLMADGEALVVANGGIETHPDAGRAKLNLPVMRPNLTYTTLSGEILEQVEPPSPEHKNSMRHLAIDGSGRVALALQWQGDLAEAPPLLMLHQRGQAPIWAKAPEPAHRAMQGYAGSVAFSGDGRRVAITSPRGGRVQLFDAATGAFATEHLLEDVCGLAPAQAGFALSTGTGGWHGLDAQQMPLLQAHALAWDNHIVALPRSSFTQRT